MFLLTMMIRTIAIHFYVSEEKPNEVKYDVGLSNKCHISKFSQCDVASCFLNTTWNTMNIVYNSQGRQWC